MKIAYADPPYPGCAKYYPEKTEVDHNKLLFELNQYDGWALSTHVPGLRLILSLVNCPPDIRIGAWVKPFAFFKQGVNPAYTWEPIIFHGGRKRTRQQPTIRDWISANAMSKTGLVGTKPKEFSLWIFEFLGMNQDDEFIDLFPGTGAVTKAWEEYKNNLCVLCGSVVCT